MVLNEAGWQALVRARKLAGLVSLSEVMPGKRPRQTLSSDEVTLMVACVEVSGAWHSFASVPVDWATSMMTGRSTQVPSVVPRRDRARGYCSC